MTDVPDPQPPATEASVDALVEIVMAGLQSGYHAGGHHPNCATREDEGCDCYARGSAAARSALVALAAHVRKLEEQLRHDGHGSPSFHLSTCPGCALLGSGRERDSSHLARC